jgi:hypothetical protein
MRIGWCMFGMLLLFTSGAFAQAQIAGTIKGNSEILFSATIQNITRHRLNISDLGGNYKIVAEPGDTVIFSHQGYYSDTLIVDGTMYGERMPIELKIKMSTLASVDVNEMSRYELDSLNRKQDYDYIFKGKNDKPLYNNKLEGDGRGVNFSPIGHWSSSEKQKRRLKERLESDDKEEFIYYKFSRRVPGLTGLRGDTLITFINKYKPSYSYCLTASSIDILIYINDHYVLFKKSRYK